MTNLGFIPDWNFQADPFPLPQAAGTNLGFVPDWQFQADPFPLPQGSLNGLGAPIDTVNAIFDSFWWRNRKWLAFGAVAALGLGIFGGITAIAR